MPCTMADLPSMGPQRILDPSLRNSPPRLRPFAHALKTMRCGWFLKGMKKTALRRFVTMMATATAEQMLDAMKPF